MIKSLAQSHFSFPARRSLKQLLILLFLVILLAEIAVMSLVVRITQSSMSQEAVKTSESLLEYYSNQLENQMNFAQKDLRILADDTTLVSSGLYENPLEQQYFQKLHMKSYMKKILDLNTILDGIFVYRPTADILPYFAVSSKYTSYEQELQLQKQIESADLLTASGYWSFWHIDEREYLLYLEKGIYGWYGIWIRAQSILQNFEILSPDSQSGVYVCDSDGNILESQSLLSFSDTFLQTDSGSISKIDGKKYIKVVTRTNQEDYMLAALLPEAEILKEMGAIWPVLVIAFITNLFLFLLCIFCGKRFVYEPLHYLTAHMETVKEGNLETEIELGGHLEEFEAVYSTFNEMQKSIIALKLDNYERKIQEEQTKRQFLQSQIKSHFFLNCLNIIYMLAQGKQYELIQKLDLCMANYMRYLTRPAEQPVTLLQELEHVKNYMTIQVLRYHNRIRFSCELEEDSMNQYQVYPLMIQTFVENSMKYAMDPEAEENHVSVKIVCISDNPELFSIVIEDSGEGFSEEMLRQLNNPVSIPMSGLSGIGIANVKARIHLFYKGKGSIHFSNSKEHGGRVELRLPING